MEKQILAADDLRTDSTNSKKRSELIRKFAIMLAHQLKEGVKLVHAVDLTTVVLMESPGYGMFIEETIRQSKKALQDVSIKSDVKIEKKHIEGPAAANLIKLAQDSKHHECIVIGTQGHTGIGRLLLGSVAEEVVRFSKVPVVTIGSKVENSIEKISKILVATELGTNSKKAEDYALRLAKAFHAEVVLVHCLYGGLHHILQMAMASSDSRKRFNNLLEDVEDDIAKKLERKMKALRKEGVRASYIINDEPLVASDVLLKEINKTGVDLVVMGTHGRNIVGRAFLGSTVREVILSSPVPVVTVRSK